MILCRLSLSYLTYTAIYIKLSEAHPPLPVGILLYFGIAPKSAP
jgi:hypothetical protein